MEARALARRVVLRFMAAACVLVVLATAAMPYSRRNPTLSGVWQDWGDSVWEYYYFAPTDCEYWRFKSNQQVRFTYKCTPGQWWQYSSNHGGYSPIGLGGVNNDFLGDDEAIHNVSTTWAFGYRWYQDCAYWFDRTDNNETRFAYKYGPGQWWDYTTPNNASGSGWGHLGIGALATAAFIGDGEWHTFDTANMPGGNYLGLTADAEFRYYGGSYYWRCAGTERVRFTYGAGYTGTWYYGGGGGTWYSMNYNGLWENPDARYHGGGIFILSGLEWDYGTNRPSSVPSPRTIEYDVYNVGEGSWNPVTSWNIYNPGTDNKWTAGGLLNVLWCSTRHYNGSSYVDDWMAGYGEYTIPDVIVFRADFEENPIGFLAMIGWMTIVRDYFRQQISTVTVAAHGTPTSWSMGGWMTTSNYTNFWNDWVRWGTLMTADGQIVSLHCEVGNATTMLNAIAAWSGCDIYANTNVTYTNANPFITPYQLYIINDGREEDPHIWNWNMQNVYWLDDFYVADGRSYPIRNFEYKSGGPSTPRWTLYY